MIALCNVGVFVACFPELPYQSYKFHILKYVNQMGILREAFVV